MDLRVNPTRMELLRLRRRLLLARKGHSLLKEKRDGLIQHFVRIGKEVRRVYGELASEMQRLLSEAALRTAELEGHTRQIAFTYPMARPELLIQRQNIMGVNISIFRLEKGGNPISFGGIFYTPEFLSVIRALDERLDKIITLAGLFRSYLLLGREILRIKRRVSALEYILIPELERKVSYIEMRLGEMERETAVALIKIKELVIETRE